MGVRRGGVAGGHRSAAQRNATPYVPVFSMELLVSFCSIDYCWGRTGRTFRDWGVQTLCTGKSVDWSGKESRLLEAFD